MSRRLEVLLQNRLIGHLLETPDRGAEFCFSDPYQRFVPRPVLGQKFEDDLERVHRSRKGQGLPDFFANLTPEGPLREVIEEIAGIEAGDDLGLLTFVGLDLPGAIVVRPISNEELGLSSEAPAKVPPDPTDPPLENDGLRFSLAGVQLKFSMLLKENKLTLPAKGQGGEWIVKFDSPAFPKLPENEYSMLTWAREAGFDVPECHLHAIEEVVGFPRRYAQAGTQVLAIRRYDRQTRGRIHQEDFAQAVGLPPTQKYEHITYEVMARLAQRFVDDSAVDELARRLSFVIASGNNDAHLKNWSLIYPDAVQAQWSPLYDQVSTVAWQGPDHKLALKLASIKDFGRIDRSAFQRFANKASFDEARILEQVDRTLETLRKTWREISTDLPLPKDHALSLRKHWQNVPLLRDAGPLD